MFINTAYAQQLAEDVQVTVINLDTHFNYQDFIYEPHANKHNHLIFNLKTQIEQAADLSFFLAKHLQNNERVTLHSFTSAIKTPLHYDWIAKLFDNSTHSMKENLTLIAGYHDNYSLNAFLTNKSLDAKTICADFESVITASPLTGTSNIGNPENKQTFALLKYEMHKIHWELLPGNNDLQLTDFPNRADFEHPSKHLSKSKP